MKRPDLYVSVWPHIHSGNSVERITYGTICALLPALFAGWFFFGWSSLKIVAISAVSAVVVEYLWLKIIGRPTRIKDGSALLTGILLGLVLSTECPWWIPVLGALVAVVVGRHLFGGAGNHPFSSALVGWLFLQVSYREILENFPMPEPRFLLEQGEYLIDPPLMALREDIYMVMEVPWFDLLSGNVPGLIGTISVIAVVLGGAYLLFRRIITWHIPASFILSAWIFAFIFWRIDPDVYANPTFHILSGWIMLGAFFLATEKGTAPVTAPGMIIYGIGCGCLTMVIRIWGIYIEGVPFAILLMNGLTPLLDRLKPKTIGRTKEIA